MKEVCVCGGAQEDDNDGDADDPGPGLGQREVGRETTWNNAGAASSIG